MGSTQGRQTTTKPTKHEFPNKFLTSLLVTVLVKLVIEVKMLGTWKTYLFHQLSWNRFYNLTYNQEKKTTYHCLTVNRTQLFSYPPTNFSHPLRSPFRQQALYSILLYKTLKNICRDCLITATYDNKLLSHNKQDIFLYQCPVFHLKILWFNFFFKLVQTAVKTVFHTFSL